VATLLTATLTVPVTAPPEKVRFLAEAVPIVVESIEYAALCQDESWRAWFRVDCIDCTVEVMEVRPLLAAWMV